MKNKIFLFLIILQHLTFAYKLMNSWLETPGSYSIYLTQEVDSLKNDWGLDLAYCINNVNNHGVNGVPTLIPATTTSETANCRVVYDTVIDPNTQQVDTSSIAVCSRNDFGKYDSFTIIIIILIPSITI